MKLKIVITIIEFVLTAACLFSWVCVSNSFIQLIALVVFLICVVGLEKIKDEKE